MEITVWQFVGALLLIAFPLYIMYIFRIRQLGKAVRALVKTIFGALLLGICLHYVVLWNQPVVTLLFVCLLIVCSSAIIVRRAKLELRQMLLPVIAGTSIAVLTVGFYFLLLIAEPANLLSARFLVPVAGLLLGHIIMTNSRALHIYYMGLRHHALLYRYLLGNGATHTEALDYLMRRAIQQTALPSIAYMGLLTILVSPVVLWSMILSGVAIVTAVACQLLIVVAMFCASMLSVVVTLIISRRYLLDDYSRLKEPTAPSTESTENQ